MEETPTTVEATNEPVAPEQESTEPTTADTAIEEPASGATPKLDEYEQRIESLLEAHQQKKTKAVDDAEEAKAQETLREGESWQSVLEGAPEDVQRAMASLRADYTRKTQELAQQRKELARRLSQDVCGQPVVACPKPKKALWVEPKYFCHVRYFQRTAQGRLRDASFNGLLDQPG